MAFLLPDDSVTPRRCPPVRPDPLKHQYISRASIHPDPRTEGPICGLSNKAVLIYKVPNAAILESEMSLVMVDVWKWTPMITLIVLAGLKSFPQDPYEAARIDGANPLQIFWYITLP